MNKIKDYAEDSIPVLDQSNKLLGVITSQDMVEVIDDSMKDDYAKFASLGDVEDLNETVKESLKKRLNLFIEQKKYMMKTEKWISLYQFHRLDDTV